MPKPVEQNSSFPHWVTWLSLGGAVLLFFGNTVPAMRERKQLQVEQQELALRRQQYEAAMQATRTATPGSNGRRGDLQGLLVAIDRLGCTPEELLRHYPEPKRPAGGSDRSEQPTPATAGR